MKSRNRQHAALSLRISGFLLGHVQAKFVIWRAVQCFTYHIGSISGLQALSQLPHVSRTCVQHHLACRHSLYSKWVCLQQPRAGPASGSGEATSQALALQKVAKVTQSASARSGCPAAAACKRQAQGHAYPQ